MQDPSALKNPRNLRSWRAWQGEGYRRSGFMAITAGVLPPLASAFVMGCVLLRPALRDLEIGFWLYLAAAFGLMVFAMLRLNAWQRAHPWTPPA